MVQIARGPRDHAMAGRAGRPEKRIFKIADTARDPKREIFATSDTNGELRGHEKHLCGHRDLTNARFACNECLVSIQC